MKIIGISLHDFHWFELFELCHFAYFVFTFIAIAHQMPHVSNVSDITNFVTDMRQITIKYIESHKGADIAQMHIIINRRSTNAPSISAACRSR